MLPIWLLAAMMIMMYELQRVGESFSANARARRRKRCETKATTNIAFAQGSQTSNSTS